MSEMGHFRPAFIIGSTGFTMFFVLTSLIAIPVAALCWYVLRLHADVVPDPERRGSALRLR
jgi:hypothetical protein